MKQTQSNSLSISISNTTRYFPDRGDIVPFSCRTMLVLSKRRTISETVHLLLYFIEESCNTGIPLPGIKTKVFVNLLDLNTQSYSRIESEFVVKVDEALLAEVIKDVRKVFR